MPLIIPQFPKIIPVLSQIGEDLPESVSYLAKVFPYLPLNKIMTKFIQTFPQIPQDMWHEFLLWYRLFQPYIPGIMPYMPKVVPFLPKVITHLPRMIGLSPILRIYMKKWIPYIAEVAPRYDEILSRLVPNISEILSLLEESLPELTENVASLTQAQELLHSEIDPIMLPYLSSMLPKNINHNS